MFLSRTLPLKTQNPLCSFPLIYRTLCSSPNQTDQNKKPLYLLFQEAVDLSSSTETDIHTEPQTNEVKQKLWELEKEVRELKESESTSNEDNPNVKESKQLKTPKSLFRVFTGQERPKKLKIAIKEEEQPRVFKELSDDVRMFIKHLYREGYFKDATFLRTDKLDFSYFDDSYGRDYIRFAAEKFANDNQDIARWLSGSDLKKVALLGCPTPRRKIVFSAKRLRRYFEIQENTVCSKCALKNSCQYANQNVWGRAEYKTLNLAVVMRVIILYALEASHQDLSVPEEVRTTVSRLLKQVVKLSCSAS